MSGGSYNYLYCATLSERQYEIERMVERLRELGHHDAALRTEQALAGLRLASAIQKELEDVWHAVEWIDSGDWGKGDEEKPIEAWRKKATVDEADVDIAERLWDLEEEAKMLRGELAARMRTR